MGLTAGPVPTRVDATVKAGLLALIDHATAGGWSTSRACRVLELNADRAARWRRRQQAGLGLDDATPGPGEPLHALLDWERDAILQLFDEWSAIDRSHRKLAHRGSRLEKVFVSESTVLRVLRAEDLVLPARPARDPVAARPWPAWVEYRPCQVWGHDFSAFVRAGRDALAVLDLVSRKWIATLTVPHQRGESEHVKAIYTLALKAEGLLAEAEARMIDPNADELLPILLAVSDGGPQMVSGTTREFMALHALAMHVGRPGTPTDQAHIESFFGHVKTDWPHLEAIRDPTELDAALEQARVEYNTVRLHAAIGYVTPDDEHQGQGHQIRTAPLDASSGKQQRHRLNTGGDRDANCALYQIVLTRLATDEETKLYMKRRIAEGKTKKEVIRCLKRYVAREIYKTLSRNPILTAP